MAKTDIVLQKIVGILFLGLIFFLPLIFWIPNSEVFELPKMLFVYAMTTLIVGCWLARMTVRRKILIERTPLDIPILLFLLSQIISTIYSIDPHVSWFGWYGRFNGGLISTISYTLLYYAFVSNLSVICFPFSVFGYKSAGHRFAGHKPVDRKPINHEPTTDNRGLITAILASSAIVSLYALLQHFGIDRDFWVQDVATRVFSTQGQPNWLAGYIVALIFIPISNLLNFQFSIFPPAWTSSMRSRAGNFQSILNLLIFNLLFITLLFTKSRSGLLGFAVADVVFWGLIFLSFKRFTIYGLRFTKPFFIIHCLLIILILITNNPVKDFFLNPSRLSLTHQRISASTIPNKSEFGGTESGDIRRLVWNGAMQLVKQRPILGFGPETFGLTYWQVRPKEANLTSEWNFLYNKAHNEWLNLAANTGLFGLGTHLLLLGWFCIWCARLFFNHFNHSSHFNHSTFLLAAILASLLGLETINFFGFSTVTVGAYRYLFMAWTVGIVNREQKTENKKQKTALPFTAYFLLFTVFLVVLYLLLQISRMFYADLKYNLGRQFYSAGYIEEAVEPLTRAVNLVPNEPVFRNELAEALSIAAISVLANGDQNQAIEIKNNAVENFKAVAAESKFNLAFTRTQAQMKFLMREIDPDLTDEALKLAQKAIDLSPTDPRGYYLLGRMYGELDDKFTAENLYRRALELKPDYEEAKKAILIYE